MKDRNRLIAVPRIKTLLISLMCSCVLLLTSLPALAQDVKDPKPTITTQKNTDGTTTTTEKYDGGTKATTKDSKGTLIDTVTTEPSDKFGKGGTKAKIETNNNGNDIDTVVYKDKSGNVRRVEKAEFSKTAILKDTFDVNYDETGRITSYAFGNLHRITEEGKVEYYESGEPRATGSISHPVEKVLEEGNALLAAVRKATERHMSIIEDLSPMEPPDMEAPKPKEDDSKKDTKQIDGEQPKPPEKTTTGQDDTDKPLLKFTPLPCNVALQKYSVAQASAHINGHIAHIEERKKQMADAYYYAGAATTLKTAFSQGGITTSMGYADNWKSGISSAWSQTAEEFHKYHLNILRDSLKVIEQRGYATKGELVYLDTGMQNWDTLDQNLLSQFRALVDAYTAEAQVYDQKAGYLKKYYDTLGSLSGKRPYPSDEINALNSKMYHDTKTFDDRVKQMENEDQRRINDEIRRLTSKDLFSVVKKVPGC